MPGVTDNQLYLAIERLNGPFQLDQHRVALAVDGLARRHLDQLSLMQYSATSFRSLPFRRMPTSCSNTAALKWGLRASVERWSGRAGRSVASVMGGFFLVG